MQVVRKALRPPDGDRLRLEEDTDLRADRVPPPPVRVPFPPDVGEGQQERRENRIFLAQAGVFRP